MENKTILAVDSTATVSSVALRRGGETLGEYHLDGVGTHSVTLLPMAEHILSVCGLTVDDVDIFAVSRGPGSFTGVRIGAALVKGLAFKDNKPCVGVSTLEALAYNLCGTSGIICPCMNARRGQVYTAVFRGDGKEIKRLTEDTAVSVEELARLLSEYTEKVYFCGDGYFLTEHLTDTVTPKALRIQNAASVAAVAERIYNDAADKSFSPDALVPTYLRLPQAERERLERMREEKEKND